MKKRFPFHALGTKPQNRQAKLTKVDLEAKSTQLASIVNGLKIEVGRLIEQKKKLKQILISDKKMDLGKIQQQIREHKTAIQRAKAQTEANFEQARKISESFPSLEQKQLDLKEKKTKAGKIKKNIEDLEQNLSALKQKAKTALKNFAQLQDNQRAIEGIVWTKKKKQYRGEIDSLLEKAEQMHQKAEELRRTANCITTQRVQLRSLVQKWKGKTIIPDPAETVEKLLALLQTRQKTNYDISKQCNELESLLAENERLQNEISEAREEHQRKFNAYQSESKDAQSDLDQTITSTSELEQQLIAQICKVKQQ